MILNKNKKDLTIKLIKEGCPQREIAKQSHLYFKKISETRKYLKVILQMIKQISVSDKTFILFEQNKSLVQISIEFDFLWLSKDVSSMQLIAFALKNVYIYLYVLNLTAIKIKGIKTDVLFSFVPFSFIFKKFF